jgi:UDP-N-acetylglucosamine acyltransferase
VCEKRDSEVIDNRADIHPSAKIGENVVIGPWTVIGEDVEIGDGCYIGPHVVIRGPTKLGKQNRIFQFSSIGEESQDKKFNGEKTYLEIGDNNTIREFVTINRGTVQGGGYTRIGNDNWLMAYVHVAHDCIIGNHTIFSNNASLAGHVTVEDHVILAGFSGVHQFCSIGAHSFVAKATYITKDVLPYVLVSGYTATTSGLNSEGLRRRGFDNDTLEHLKRAYKVIFRKGLTVKNAIVELQEMLPQCPEISAFINGLQNSTRGIVR